MTLAKKRVRRTWSDDEKRSICLQTLVPGVSAAQVARRYAMNANLIFKWLKDPRFQSDEQETEESAFLPVEISTANTSLLHSATDNFPPCQPGGSIKIELASGHHLTVEGGFDGTELARLLKGLVS
ncbi:MAG: transposase [Hyphomicrobiales bacterium]|nr:transposase [Hyphomicrobiales bacterium]